MNRMFLSFHLGPGPLERPRIHRVLPVEIMRPQTNDRLSALGVVVSNVPTGIYQKPIEDTARDFSADTWTLRRDSPHRPRKQQEKKATSKGGFMEYLIRTTLGAIKGIPCIMLLLFQAARSTRPPSADISGDDELDVLYTTTPVHIDDSKPDIHRHDHAMNGYLYEDTRAFRQWSGPSRARLVCEMTTPEERCTRFGGR